MTSSSPCIEIYASRTKNIKISVIPRNPIFVFFFFFFFFFFFWGGGVGGGAVCVFSAT